jgi:hypothetical protein
MVVVVVVVYNSNSVVVVHFLMSTNERTKVGEEEKNKTPSSELPPYPSLELCNCFQLQNGI